MIDIMSYIPEGRENAVSRASLCAMTGLKDRNMRLAIEDARHRGCIIINRQDGRGYYTTSDPAEIEAQRAQIHKRALNLLHQESAMRRAMQA